MVVQTNRKRSKTQGKNGIKQEKSLLIAQEISFAKVLAGNEKKLRDRGLKRLRKWLSARSKSGCVLKDEDYMRIWKGLFYCVWMSDKFLVQEELCESISSLISCFDKASQSFAFMKTFFLTMSLEWNGIDQHRIHKFLMLVRRFFRQCLVYVERHEWAEDYVEGLDTVMKLTLFPDYSVVEPKRAPGGLTLHFTDIFWEEVAKVSKGNLPEHALLSFLKRFVLFIAICSERHISEAICFNIFDRLIEQSPDGVDYNEKFSAWQKLGFPGDSLNCMERVEEYEDEDQDEDEDEELEDSGRNCQPLDPRAGKVDVELPIIAFNAKTIAEMIKGYQFKKYTTTVTRTRIGKLSKKFGELAQGSYPLGPYEVPQMPEVNMREMVEDASEDFLGMREQLLKASRLPKTINANGDNSEEDNLKSYGEDVFAKWKPTKLDILQTKLGRRARMALEMLKSSKSNDTTLPMEESEKMETDDVKMASKNADPIIDKKKGKKRSSCDGLMPYDHTIESDCVRDSGRVRQGNTPKKDSPQTEQVKGKVKRLKSSDSKITPKKKRFSLESGASSFHVVSFTEEPAQCVQGPPPEHIPQVSIVKLKRRASLPAKMHSEEAINDMSVTPDIVTPVKGSKSKKQQSNQDPWNEPMQLGETEIFISRKELNARRKSLEKANKHLETDGTKAKGSFTSPLQSIKPSTPTSSSKKVNFVLQRNRSQGTSDYFKSLRENPEIPFDARKKPSHGVLKSSPYSSPVNPFYKRKVKM